jgi:hypothetical protein
MFVLRYSSYHTKLRLSLLLSHSLWWSHSLLVILYMADMTCTSRHCLNTMYHELAVVMIITLSLLNNKQKLLCILLQLTRMSLCSISSYLNTWYLLTLQVVIKQVGYLLWSVSWGFQNHRCRLYCTARKCSKSGATYPHGGIRNQCHMHEILSHGHEIVNLIHEHTYDTIWITLSRNSKPYEHRLIPQI